MPAIVRADFRLYAKNEVASIAGPVLKKIKEEIDGGA
jgi:hypothetical protein